MSERWACATGICQRICKAHVFDETFGAGSVFNAEVFVAPPHAVAMEFDLLGERRVVIGLRAAGQQKGTSAWIARSRIAQPRALPQFSFFWEFIPLVNGD